ncbi:MAG: hypothetical protein K8H86_02345 [Ignavibacteriaceae bacterium]|nr:hypothetical protein [Ignavibacteriaceae bacterium]
MKRFGQSWILIPLLFVFFGCQKIEAQKGDTLFVAFWNMENFFDTADDPEKNDAEFLPASEREWTQDRFDKKSHNMSRVILSMNNGTGPDVLGMSEVENKGVVQSMVDSFLNTINYVAVHDDSPDKRGIDVSLIFNDDKFDLISSEGLVVELPDNYPTRNILHAVLKTNEGDTIHFFVNHWPSRRGGKDESSKNRVAAASVLKQKVNQLFADNPCRIIIMGDFNDEPGDISILKTLDAKPFICKEEETIPAEVNYPQLLNLAYKKFNDGEGSYKYRDDWNMLDQIIVSGKMAVSYRCGSFTIYKPNFLLTRSGKFEGTPFPTYGGSRYLGGYSDHFPVFAKFVLK